MGKLKIVFLVVSVYTAIALYSVFKDGEKPLLKVNFWGPKSKESQKEDTSVRPFEIKIEENVLKDLKARLKLELSPESSRLQPPLEGIGFEYGFNTNFLKTVGQHWLDKYDWRQREKQLNLYPQFKTRISGLDIHFQHVKSKNNKNYKKTRPLLLLHGWPGSFVEFQKIIPLLTDPKDSDINFELVIPSLPGYGFSEGSHRTGMGIIEMAQIFHKLMLRLKFDKFYIQGGDWGSAITTVMATLFEENVVGLHMNGCVSFHPRSTLRRIIASFFPTYFMEAYEADEIFPTSKSFSLLMREMGYAHIQATKPDTVGVGLSNSPIGLCAYILEKFSTWTNLDGYTKPDGGLVPHYNLDELLDNVMVYWVTGSITTSMRLYSEALTSRITETDIAKVPVTVPTACIGPRKEFMDFPEFLLKDKYPNLIRYTKTNGGHFTAFEVPTEVAKDIIETFDQFEKAGLSRFE